MNHRSIPSLSSSISSSENNTPRTSSSSCSTTNNYYLYQNFNAPPTTSNNKLTHTSSLKVYNTNAQEAQSKRYSEPLVPVKRWDDSQLEMELAEDDLIMDKKKNKVRRNSSLRFKQSYIIDKFRQHRQEEEKKTVKFTRPFKKLYDWLF
ncbi:hypothetical protein MFLAVUS_009011 [Mucor flavus]|uniref:Uncharacterized protein n=1 Tax=Mucor flavus TaxID=439312 RepID=A0ABP9Z8T3_9FUNG